MRAMRLIRDVRLNSKTCERRETRDARDVTESADTAATRTYDGMIDAQGGSNGAGSGGNTRDGERCKQSVSENLACSEHVSG
jgi:hypothetical protein